MHKKEKWFIQDEAIKYGVLPNILSLKYVYEVIRVMDKKPLFFHKHILRLNKGILSSFSAQASEITFLKNTHLLLSKLNITEGNIKIVYFIDKNNKRHILMYQIQHYYPSEIECKNGVNVELLHAERKTPQTKLWNKTLREQADNHIQTSNIFEVLLVNKSGIITEGSRSNVLFVKGNKIISPPNNLMLEGVTRSAIIKIAKHNNIEYIEQNILEESLRNFDAAILTGTSLNILSIKQIEDIAFELKNDLICMLKKSLLKSIENNLKTFNYE